MTHRTTTIVPTIPAATEHAGLAHIRCCMPGCTWSIVNRCEAYTTVMVYEYPSRLATGRMLYISYDGSVYAERPASTTLPEHLDSCMELHCEGCA